MAQRTVTGAIFVFLVCLVPGSAAAADPVEDLVRRLEALERELRDLQAELAALKSAQPQASLPAPLPAGPPDSIPAPAPAPAAAPGARSGSGILNPDVGVIGNFIGAAGDSAGGTSRIAPFDSFTLQESEVSLQAVVDPYSRADFFLAIGEDEIEVEEGYVTFPTIPGGFLLKAGRMRASFGRLNAFHNHSLPWIDRPLVMFNLLGGTTDDPDTGIKDAGVSISRLIPAGSLFVEATAEVFRGESGTLFSASQRSDLAAVGHVRGYGDFSNTANLELGASYARGHNENGSGFLTQLYGADATFRWKPPHARRSFTGRAELVWSHREQVEEQLGAFGAYVSGDFQFSRRWFTGLRWDWSERPDNPALHDSGASWVLTFWPSEFGQIRGQYRRSTYAEGRSTDELLLQILFAIGAHGAHPF